MAIKTNTNQPLMIRTLAAAMLLPLSTAHAAPGTLADAPLFLTSAVKPNILFVTDDSGSMDWEVQMSNGALVDHSNNPNSGNLDFTPEDVAERLELCAGYNVLAYNPDTSYSAWAGKDNAGNSFPASMPLTAARNDPYVPGTTTDLSSHFYFLWTDSNGDGTYQNGECPTPPVNNSTDCASNATECVRVSTLTAAQQTNYANWFSYYRKREYVAKRAMSELIKNSTSRMGLATLHNNNSVLTLIADVDDITTPVNTTAQTSKATLLNNVARINSNGGTPLRLALKEAGEYYAGNSSWGSSPILPANQGGECQQNFTILMSDGYWNGNTPSVGNQDDSPTPWAGGSFADTYGDTLADVAMKYYKEDLSSHANNVPVTSVDPQNLNPNKMHQHMVTFTAAFGVNGTLTSNPSDQTTAFAWPEPVSNEQSTIDDMRHAAWNGRGDFLSAEDPQSLIAGLDAALAAISGRTSSGSSVAFNTSSLSTNSQVYLALFNSDKWSGDLQSYPLDAVTGEVGATAKWKAGPKLDVRDLSTNPRVMYTWNGSDGVAFQWDNLTASQKSDLRTNSVGGTDSEATGLARMHYVRGDRVCEQNYPGTGSTIGSSSTASCTYTDSASSTTYSTANLRQRDSRLGDIIHSAPVYVGKPGSGWPDTMPGTTPYTNFKLAKDGRAGMIYVGGNDGMLHAFSESTGAEEMAYVPSAVFSTAGGRGLHALSEQGYSHKYYVDLTPTAVDAFVKTSAADTASWKTVLVGALGGGGRGLFALDVTTPSYVETGTGPADKVMWEFTAANDADLGYTFSRPSIALMNNGKWAAIFGNGYNDSGTGQAKLFILYLEGGLDGTWSATDYVKISTGVGDTTDRNGLGTPAVVDMNGDGVADRIYAGDLKGNMWVFDVTASNAGTWGSAYKSGTTANPLFTAPANQQITSRPEIVLNPVVPSSNANFPNVIVLFGTGQYLVANDNTTTDQQAFYGVWDEGTGSLDQTDLVQQTIGTGSTSEGISVRTLTSNTVDYGNGDLGWYMNLPASGERIVTSPVVRGKNVYFNTAIPDSSPCSYGGTGWKMVADYATGGAPLKPAFDANNDGKVDNLDKVGDVGAAGESTQGLPTDPVNLGDRNYTSTTETKDGESIDQTILEKLKEDKTGRLSWEELMRQ